MADPNRPVSAVPRGPALELAGFWRHPDHGQAHLERGGALHHLHRLPEAIADARRACDLGVTEACAIAKRFGNR